MSLRWRWALTSAAVAVAAVVLVGLAAGALTARGLRAEVDRTLVDRAGALSRIPPGDLISRLPELPNRVGGVNLLRPLIGNDFEVQVIGDRGSVAFRFDDAPQLPIGEDDLAVVRGDRDRVLQTVGVGGVDYRMVTAPLRRGAVQIARDLTPISDLLRLFGRRLLLVGALVAGLAAVTGWWLAGRTTRPIEQLTDAAEEIAATQDLTSMVPQGGSDEVGRLASSFATMLSALADSRRQQQRLVSDAGHELRTPLTGLRTNIEVLRRQPGLAPEEKAQLFDDALGEMDELGKLVDELVSLATDAAASEEPKVTGLLSDFVSPVVERYGRLLDRDVVLVGVGAEVSVRPTQIERAVGNLIDNAAKWSPADSVIEVIVDGSTVTVRDLGPGLDPEDIPRLFDRFYRAPAGRTLPGSGLGLAIVKQAVEANGGTVFARNAKGPGAEVGFILAPDAT